MHVVNCNGSFRRIARQILIPSISALSTLADVSVVESAGCFTYSKDSETVATRNRFIVWRSIRSQLFLEEHCFDYNLTQNVVCIQFQNSIVLPGTQIVETPEGVVILVATVCSVHRIILPHPSRAFSRKKVNSGESYLSILSEIDVNDVINPHNHYVLNVNGSTGPTASACVLSWNEEALFALGRNDGSIILVTLPNVNEEVVATQDVLRQSSTVKRIWSGLVTPLGYAENSWLETSSDFLFHVESNDIVLYSLCCDYKLRVWSCKKKDIMATVDILNFCPEYQNVIITPNYVDGQKWRLHKVDLPDSHLLITFISIENLSQHDLLNFVLNSNRLWTCWRSNEETIVKYVEVNLDRLERGPWQSVNVDFSNLDLYHSTMPLVIDVDEIIDYVFQPIVFSYEVIYKAIKISCKDFNMPTFNGDNNELKNQFRIYLKKFSDKMSNQKRMLSENIVADLTLEELFDNLNSCLLQYQKVNTKVLGIFILPFTEIVPGIIAIDRFACLFYPDKIDSVLCPKSLTFTEENGPNSVYKLLQCINKQYTKDNNGMNRSFDSCVLSSQNNERPFDFVQNRQAIELFTNLSSSALSTLGTLLIESETTLLSIFEDVIRLLEPDLNLCHTMSHSNTESEYSSVIVGDLWKDFLCCYFRQTICRRYETIKNLFVILALCFHFRTEMSYSQDIWSKFDNQFSHSLNRLCRYYAVLRWFVNLKDEKSTSDYMDSGIEKLSALHITTFQSSQTGAIKVSDNKFLINNFFETSQWMFDFRRSLINLLNNAHSINLHTPQMGFESVTLQATELCLSYFWPVQQRFVLFDFLAQSEQSKRLVELCNYLFPWCTDLIYCRIYVKACALLRLNKPDEALLEFRKAYLGLEQYDSCLIDRLNLNQFSPDEYAIHYYQDVAELFEQSGYNEHVIELCRDGIKASGVDKTETYTLWTLLFRHYLQTENFGEAFFAMNQNPDLNSRKTCLRSFVIEMLELKRYEELISYQYTKLETDFVEILEFRARTADVLVENYYDVLCSYFMNKSNYRRAAFYFYELAQRLKFETLNLESLRCRVNSLCSCVQNLSLARDEYKWIVRPCTVKKDDREPAGASPKRSSDGEELPFTLSKTIPSLQIVEIDEIKKELCLTKANLIVATKTKLGVSMPSEAVSVLINLNEFDVAVSIAVNFDLPLDNIFEGLTLACLNIRSSKIPPGTKCSNFEWLENNRNYLTLYSPEFKYFFYKTHILPARNAVSFCWKILESYLDHFSKFRSPSALYRCVCRCLLSRSQDLPTWFTSKFKKIDVAEYVRLLLEFDRLDAAQNVLCDFLEAILGNGMEDFALKNALHIGQPAVCIPYSCIDQLLCLLAVESTKNPRALEKKSELEAELKKYFQQLNTVSIG